FPALPRGRRAGALALPRRPGGLVWAVWAGVCPTASLLLLSLVPQHTASPAFMVAVGGLGVAFGLTTAWLIGRLVTEPVDLLRAAAHAVAAGGLSVRVGQLRADEVGPLIGEFDTLIRRLPAETPLPHNTR